MTDPAPIRARSWLFTPATRPERFAKAAAAGADVAILDLEDAVALRDKCRSRTIAIDYLADRPPKARATRCGLTGSTRRRGFPTWTRCSDPGPLQTF
jgi:(S)-citramalyl-CoA lyase